MSQPIDEPPMSTQELPTQHRPARALDTTRVLEAVADVQDSFIAGRSPGDVFDQLLEHVLAITDSEYGYIGEVLEDDQGPFLKAYAMTDISWDEASRRMYEQARQGGGFEFRNLKTLFGAVLVTGEPVIANDAPNDPRSGGTMRGHLPLDRYLGLPLFSEGELVGSVGVSNRPGGYDEAMVAALRPFLSTCGNLVRAFCNQRSLAEAESRARAKELELRTVVSAAGDGIVSFDPQGRIRSTNRAAQALLRVPNTPDLTIWDIAAPGQRRMIESLIAAADGRVAEVILADAAGDLVPVDVSVSSADLPEGRVCIAILRDATIRRRTEQELTRARDQAERTSRAKDEFLAAVSHELRNPLNGVIGLSTILAGESAGPLNERQAGYVRMISASGEHLLALVNDILDLTKIEADHLRLDVEEVDLAEVVAHACDLTTSAHPDDDRTIAVDLDLDGPLQADRRRLAQILMNLLSNALKFTPRPGQVGLRATGTPTEVRIEVWDEGIGVDPKDHDTLFQPFQQIDSSLARMYEGAGLGLALTDRLVRLHGGAVGVAQRPEGGSTFTVTLPRVPPID